MNLKKAIEIGKQYIRDGEFHDLDDFEDFVDLGIEAMKGIIAIRCGAISNVDELLQGETEE